MGIASLMVLRKTSVVAVTAAASAVAVSHAARTHHSHPLDLSARRPSNARSARPTATERTNAAAAIAAAMAVADGHAGMIPAMHPQDPNAQLAPWKFRSLTFFIRFCRSWPCVGAIAVWR